MGFLIIRPVIPGVYRVSVLSERLQKGRFIVHDKYNSSTLVELRIVPQPDAFKRFYLPPYRAAVMPSHRVNEVSDQRDHVLDLFNRSISYYPVEYLAISFGRYYRLFIAG